MTESFQGSCLCGTIRYELLSPPRALSHCHCSQCRKGHGAAFASYASVPRSDLRILSGAEALKYYASSESVLRQFCSHCGSSLFWSKNQGEFSDWISIALGTLDTAFTPHKQKHVQVASTVPWFELPDHWAQTE
ncbi:GFA family protein [Pseudomonas sp. LA21]|uniref:GFA family protein n=1 Tax=unclassified Pseudomonas TaxID=196821 RepID=UPI001FB701FD|nr:GFA family protein [Pseudomonas sp. LA21]MCJ1886625.1 GFA family protein [Pseudomonas sp. LA21]